MGPQVPLMLKRKYWRSVAPVLTNCDELDGATTTSTVVPTWVSVTVPLGVHSTASADVTPRPTAASAEMSSTDLPTLDIARSSLAMNGLLRTVSPRVASDIEVIASRDPLEETPCQNSNPQGATPAAQPASTGNRRRARPWRMERGDGVGAHLGCGAH